MEVNRGRESLTEAVVMNVDVTDPPWTIKGGKEDRFGESIVLEGEVMVERYRFQFLICAFGRGRWGLCLHRKPIFSWLKAHRLCVCVRVQSSKRCHHLRPVAIFFYVFLINIGIGCISFSLCLEHSSLWFCSYFAYLFESLSSCTHPLYSGERPEWIRCWRACVLVSEIRRLTQIRYGSSETMRPVKISGNRTG